MTSNVAATSTTGLYGISSNVRVPNSASQLLNLLYSNGNVNFSLAPGNTQVQANAMVSSGGGSSTYGNANVATFLNSFGSNAISTTGNITAGYFVGNAAALDRTTGAATGTYGSDTIIPTIIVDAKGRITNITTNVISGGGSYGNSNVAAYLASNTDATISTLNANAAVQAVQINTVNANIGAYQTFANANAATQATSINSINANLGSFQTYANVTFSTVANAASQQTQIDGIVNGTTTLANVKSTGGYFWANGTAYSTGSGSTYGNTQVAAFLPVYGGPLLANVITGPTSSDLVLQAGITKDINILGAAGGGSDILIQTNQGEIVIDASSGSGSYGATMKSAALINLLAPNVYTTGQFTSTGGYFWANGTPYATSGGSYGNVEVSAYLASNTDPTISTLNANAAVQAVQINTINANIGAYQTYANANAATQATSINSINANLGAYQTYGNVTFSTIANAATQATSIDSINANLGAYQTYGNVTFSTIANAASQQTQIDGIVNGTTTLANVKSTGGYFWANGTAYSTGGSGTYGNTEVAAYLDGSAGTIRSGGTNNLQLIGGVNTVGTGALFTLAPATVSIGGFPGPVAYFNTTNVAVGSGNISTSYGPTMGTCLYDTVNERLFINAFPLSTPDSSVSNNIYSNFMVVNPVYTNNQVQQPPLANATIGGATIVSTSSQVVGLVQSSNIALQSGYGFASQNRNTVGTLVGMTVNPVTANSMNNNDRVRAFTAAVEYQSNIGWGALSTTSQNASSINALSGIVYLNNGSSIGSAVGTLTGAIITPPAGLTSNVQYATGVMPFTNLLNTAGTTGKSNVVYSRAVAPFITGFSSNLTVQYAVGLHTYSGWAGSGVVGSASNPILGRFVVLNEDVNSTIQTNGNLTVTGNTSLAAYTESQQDYGNTGGTINFSVYSASGSVKSLTLTANLTVNTNNVIMPKGGTLTLIITQDGTGSRTLTSNIKFAGGSKTLSTAAGAIDTVSIYNDGTNLLAALVKGYA